MRPILFLPALGLLAASAGWAPAQAQTIGPCSPEKRVEVGWYVLPIQPCPGDSFALVFSACPECVQLLGARVVEPLKVLVRARGPEVCPQTFAACTPESLIVPLGPLGPGAHKVRFEIAEEVELAVGGTCIALRADSTTIMVPTDCEQPGPLPYVQRVAIGPPPPDSICAGEPIPVTIAGEFPSSCYRLADIQVLTPACLTCLPVVQLLVERDVCREHVCAQAPVPWSASVQLPGLPPGAHRLQFQEELRYVDCSGPIRSDLYRQIFPISVGGPCPPPGPCLLSSWDHSAGTDRCDAFVSPGKPAAVTLMISSPVALAGLQGTIGLSPAGLRITALEAVGPAAGMHLVWDPTADGARFVLFAGSEAPIPPGSNTVGPVPVLRVTADVVPGATVPAVTRVSAFELLGSDAGGRAVPECPIMTSERFADPAARICAGVTCDWNGDGRADVRDLVLMVRCLLEPVLCPPDGASKLDCNQDGQATIDDVLCCARTILRGPGPGNVPGRDEPTIAVRFGDPVETEAELSIPVRISGADRIGAARLALDYPGDRFQVLSVDAVRFTTARSAPASDWLCLNETSGGRLTIGLIGLSSTPGASDLDLVIRLARSAGGAAGGRFQVQAGEFSGPDGAALTVNLGQPAVDVSARPRVALSQGEPNPFARETRLTLSLAEPAFVNVAVHDLSGRVVAVLFRGPLAAGEHPLVWNGTSGDGSSAPEGLYFLRAQAGSDLTARKVILLRGK